MQAPDDKLLAAVKTLLRDIVQSRRSALLPVLARMPPASAVSQYYRMYLERFQSEEAHDGVIECSHFPLMPCDLLFSQQPLSSVT